MKVLVTGGAGFVGSHVVDELVAAGHEVVVVDDLDPAAHDGLPDGLAESASYVWGDIRDPDVWARVLDGVDAVCHQAAKVGLGVDFADVGEYVGRNEVGTASLLRALHDRGFAGRIVLASSMVVYGEGRYRCADHGLVRPGPRRVADLDAGRFEPPCPVCGGPLVPRSRPRGSLARPAQRVRHDEAGPGGTVRGVRPRARRVRRHAVALPQRVRAADAARHAVRRGRQHVPQRVRAWRGAAGVRGRRAAPRLRPRHRCRSRQRAGVHRSTSRRRVRSTCAPASPRTILDMAGALRPDGAPAPDGGRRLPARRRPPRVRQPAAGPRRARVQRHDHVRGRDARLRHRAAASASASDRRLTGGASPLRHQRRLEHDGRGSLERRAQRCAERLPWPSISAPRRRRRSTGRTAARSARPRPWCTARGGPATKASNRCADEHPHPPVAKTDRPANTAGPRAIERSGDVGETEVVPRAELRGALPVLAGASPQRRRTTRTRRPRTPQ